MRIPKKKSNPANLFAPDESIVKERIGGRLADGNAGINDRKMTNATRLKRMVLILTLACSGVNAEAQFREWTSAEDGRTLLAEFEGAEDGQVTLRRRIDGKRFTLSLDVLSKEDQDWVAAKVTELAAKKASSSAVEANEYTKLVSGAWERHEDEGLEFRFFGGKRLQNVGPGATDKKYPLLVFLHGRGGDVMTAETPWAAGTFSEEKNYEERPCFILAPQAPSDSWSGENGEAVLEIIENLVENLAVDENRIYLIGYSMGAYGTFYLLAREPKLFAAGAPVAGGGNPASARSLRKIPIWVFHGARDPTVDVEQSRRMVEALEDARGEVRYTEYPEGDHGIMNRVLEDPEFHAWLFEQAKS